MKVPTIAAGSLTSATLLTIGVTVGGFSSARAVPGDYSTLPVDPNQVSDSLAYAADQSIQNPNGQPGVTNTYTHRDGTRQITNTILILPDPASATAALNGSQADVAGKVADGKTQPAAVGSGGTVVSGMSPDGTRSVTLLKFTEGNDMASSGG